MTYDDDGGFEYYVAMLSGLLGFLRTALINNTHISILVIPPI